MHFVYRLCVCMHSTLCCRSSNTDFVSCLIFFCTGLLQSWKTENNILYPCLEKGSCCRRRGLTLISQKDEYVKTKWT